MTPLQARTAGAEVNRYALCVVPINDVDIAAMEDAALVDLVRMRARFVTDIGADAGATAALVDRARARPVSLGHDEKLRYAVPSSRWSAGLNFVDWIELLLRGNVDGSSAESTA